MSPASPAGNKTRNWKDVQLIISSISLAAVLGLWGMWSSREKRVAGVESAAVVPTQPVSAEAAPMLLPGQILYLNGDAPQAASNTSTQPNPNRRNRDDRGGGGGGGGGGGASTGSS